MKKLTPTQVISSELCPFYHRQTTITELWTLNLCAYASVQKKTSMYKKNWLQCKTTWTPYYCFFTIKGWNFSPCLKTYIMQRKNLNMYLSNCGLWGVLLIIFFIRVKRVIVCACLLQRIRVNLYLILVESVIVYDSQYILFWVSCLVS